MVDPISFRCQSRSSPRQRWLALRSGAARRNASRRERRGETTPASFSPVTGLRVEEARALAEDPRGGSSKACEPDWLQQKVPVIVGVSRCGLIDSLPPRVGISRNTVYNPRLSFVPGREGGVAVVKKLALVAICLAYPCGNAMAQDAKTVVANAQKALGDPKSITYSGTAKDVAFQQCGANAVAMICQGTHDPMRPINNYVRVIDLTTPASRHTGATNNPVGGGATTPEPGTFFVQVTTEQADVSQPWGNSLEFYITPWGFLKGAAENTATAGRRRVDGKNYTVVTWSPTVKAPSGKNYVINGYVNERNLLDRVETWLGDNIMGDMHIVATYTGWKDFGGAMAPSKIVQTRGGWPFFEVDVTAAKANPADIATLIPPPAPAAGRGGPGAAPAAGAGRGGPGGAAPALTVTSEKLGDGLYRLTTGPG